MPCSSDGAERPTYGSQYSDAEHTSRHSDRAESTMAVSTVCDLKMDFADKMNEAAQIAQQLIFSEPWSPANPRCCSLYCCNRFNAQTGIWTPPHVFLPHETLDKVRIAENLWWRNKQAARGFYTTSMPPVKLTKLMRRDKSHDVFYVACSESCLDDVKEALDTIHWRNPLSLRLYVGVDKVWLHNYTYSASSSDTDSDTYSASSTEDHAEL